MSVAEIKAQADALSFEELSDLARHVRALTLRKDPARLDKLKAAQSSKDWVSQAEFEKAVAERSRSGS